MKSGNYNGVGASRFVYYPDHPSYLCYTLPLRTTGANLENAPLPSDGVLPLFASVRIFSHETSVAFYANLIDLGPEGGLNRGIDLLSSTLVALGLTKEAGMYRIGYHIIGWAQYIWPDLAV